MNPYAKLLTGGAALLATTALTSGSVYAASVVAAGLNSGTLPAAFTAVKIANKVVSGTTGSTTALGPLTFSILSSASSSYTGTTSVLLNFTNAQITGTAAVSVAALANSSLTASSLTGATATMFSDHILISLTGTWGALQVSGVSFNNAQALATAGTSISVSGTVTVSGIGQTEGVTSANLVTSVAGPQTTITPLTTVQASNTSTPPFINFGSSTQLTADLGTVTVAAASGASLTLLGSLTTSDLTSTATITVTHPALANAAVVSARIGVNAATVQHTAAEMTSGTQTFTFSKTNLDAAGTLPMTVSVVFNGTTQITGGKGGTASITFNAGNTSQIVGAGALDGATGNLADVTLNGLSADVNTAQSSANAFPSYIRIHNTGSSAGVATIVVKNDGTGATIGTYTTASIPAGATLQVGTGQIETALSITPSATTPYELQITGAFTGYVQHLGFDGKSLIDLDGFRAASNP